MKNSLLLCIVFLLACTKQEKMVRYDRPDAAILKGVYVPEGAKWYMTSGLVASVKDPDAAPGSYGRYGNLREQCISTMKNIESTLALSGFSLDDVVHLRIYLAPDSTGKIDWNVWFDVYNQFYNNETRSIKVARTTLAVHSLARPDLLVEIEATAARL